MVVTDHGVDHPGSRNQYTWSYNQCHRGQERFWRHGSIQFCWKQYLWHHCWVCSLYGAFDYLWHHCWVCSLYGAFDSPLMYNNETEKESLIKVKYNAGDKFIKKNKQVRNIHVILTLFMLKQNWSEILKLTVWQVIYRQTCTIS